MKIYNFKGGPVFGGGSTWITRQMESITGPKDSNIKILSVLNAIKNISEISPKGQSFLVNPKDKLLNGIRIIELDSILLKLMSEYKIINIEKCSKQSVNYHPTRMEKLAEDYQQSDYRKSYVIKTLSKFNDFYEEFCDKAEYKNEVNDSEKKILPDDIILRISYSEISREIVLNDIFLLSKPNFTSTNEIVFRYLYNNPNKQITKSDLETNATREPFSKSLHEIVQELGFKKDLKTVFFNVSKTNITFRNPISNKDLQDLDIKKIKISVN